MGINKNKIKLLDESKLPVEQHRCSVTAVIIFVDILAWKDLGFVIFLEKKKVEKLLTFDNLYDILSSSPCAAKGTYPDGAKTHQTWMFQIPASRTELLPWERTDTGGNHSPTALPLGLVAHPVDRPALLCGIQMTWGCDTKANAVCSEGPDAQHCRIRFLTLLRTSLCGVRSAVRFRRPWQNPWPESMPDKGRNSGSVGLLGLHGGACWCSHATRLSPS